MLTIITKEIKNINLKLGTGQVGQFQKLDTEAKDFTDQTLLANAPRPLAEKYERSKIEAS